MHDFCAKRNYKKKKTKAFEHSQTFAPSRYVLRQDTHKSLTHFQRQSLSDRSITLAQAPRVHRSRPCPARHQSPPRRSSVGVPNRRRSLRRPRLLSPATHLHRRNHGPPSQNPKRHGGTEMPLHSPQHRIPGTLNAKGQPFALPFARRTQRP